MRRISIVIVVLIAFAATAVAAQASIVYRKGNAIYIASNAGKGSKLLVANGRNPGLMPNGQTVVYADPKNALFAIPAAGGTPVKLAATNCAACLGQPSPDSASIAYVNASGDLDLIPVNGGPPSRLATGVSTFASFSPDSKQVAFDQSGADAPAIFTVPVAGGAPTQLALGVGTTPVWTQAGIVAVTAVAIGNKPQFRLVLLDAGGAVKRVLQRKTFKTAKALNIGRGIQIPFQAAGSNVLTFEPGKKNRAVLRLISTSSGKVKATRKFKDFNDVQAISGNGKTILVKGKKGRLDAVSFKTGKRKTLIAKGVKTANMN